MEPSPNQPPPPPLPPGTPPWSQPAPVPWRPTTSPRPALFVAPDIADDLRQLPSIFTTRRLLWLPLGLLVLGLPLALVFDSLSVDVADIVWLYLQLFFLPPALFVFLITGLVAPRASYLVGIVAGIVAGIIWTLAILLAGLGVASYDPVTVTVAMVALGVVYGTLMTLLGRFVARFIAVLRAS